MENNPSSVYCSSSISFHDTQRPILVSFAEKWKQFSLGVFSHLKGNRLYSNKLCMSILNILRNTQLLNF
jgi:hypothetical protein